jgi:hypothetical protein
MVRSFCLNSFVSVTLLYIIFMSVIKMDLKVHGVRLSTRVLAQDRVR